MKYRLGLDIGSSSIGWCIFETVNNIPVRIIDMGVRIFTDGRNPKTKTPLAVERRMARGARRQRDRRLQRINALVKQLKACGLMPENKDAKKLEVKNPYKIRAKAVHEEVSLYELGRALFHINRRRGFKSNRKADKGADENESSAMKKAIEDLNEKLGEQTLGEFLYERQKKGENVRVRAETIKNKNTYDIYADRSMYEKEFDRIWDTQSKFHKELTPELRQKIYGIIFNQRPLKVPERGFCQFEKDERREYLAMPISQIYRIYAEVAQLEIIAFEGDDKRLTPSERNAIANELLFNTKKLAKKDGEITFEKISQKILNLPKSTKFNLQSENRKGLFCDKTAFIMSQEECFGADWHKFSFEKQSDIIKTILNVSEKPLSDDELEELLSQKYSLSQEKSVSILNKAMKLPDGTGSLSAVAMSKILPHLKEWNVYNRACALAGYNFNQNYSGEILDKLPYYGQVLKTAAIGATPTEENLKFPEKYYGKITNPTVHVALNQVRKVVNKIIDIYGKPTEIVVETARDLPLGEKGISELKKNQVKNKEDNDRIAKKLEPIGVNNNYQNRMKFKIWEDLNKVEEQRCCPFCGKQIPLNAVDGLFSRHFEIEHLLPFSETFDDSRNNKVIACKDCNHMYKGKKSPFEAFGHIKDKDNPRNYDAILARAKDFTNAEKRLWRFQEDAMQRFKDEESDLIARTMNDTRYMTRATREYLTSIVEAKNVYTVKGLITGLLRNKWGINKLLNDPTLPQEEADEKNRNDNRHHAIDAFILCTISRAMIQRIAQSAKLCEDAGYEKIVADIGKPFDDFDYDEMKKHLDKMLISFKPDRGNAANAVKNNKTLGSLHNETALGAINFKDGDNSLTLAKRIKIETLDFKEKNIEEVADEKIKKDLKAIYEEVILAGADKKVWVEELSKYAKNNSIRRIRIHLRNNELSTLIPIKDKNGKIYKYYANAENYCMDIYLPSGEKKWHFKPVSMFEAHQKNYIPKWRKTDPHAKLVMRLFKQDILAFEENGNIVYKRITSIWGSGVIQLMPLNKNFIDKDDKRTSKTPSSLQKLNARKVYIDEAGRLFDPGKAKYSE